MVKAKAKDITRIGHVCDCPKGSPSPGYVIQVPKLHDKNCHVRRMLAEISYSKGDMLNN
jgi:hypothetical protein